ALQQAVDDVAADRALLVIRSGREEPARPRQGPLAADGDTLVRVREGDRVASPGRCHTAGPVAAFASKAILHVAVPLFGSNVPDSDRQAWRRLNHESDRPGRKN